MSSCLVMTTQEPRRETYLKMLKIILTKFIEESKGNMNETWKAAEIDRLNTVDPKQFWNAINKLEPCQSNNIPFEVYMPNGNISSNLNDV